MKSHETKSKFVEMRAQGMSLRTIAAELGMSVDTLWRWQRSMKQQIEAKAAIERECIVERFKLTEMERLTRYCGLYVRAAEQVDRDYLQILPTDHLPRMMLSLDGKISKALATTHADEGGMEDEKA